MTPETIGNPSAEWIARLLIVPLPVEPLRQGDILLPPEEPKLEEFYEAGLLQRPVMPSERSKIIGSTTIAGRVSLLIEFEKNSFDQLGRATRARVGWYAADLASGIAAQSASYRESRTYFEDSVWLTTIRIEAEALFE